MAPPLDSSAPHAPGSLPAGPRAAPGSDAEKGWNSIVKKSGQAPDNTYSCDEKKPVPSPTFWALLSGPESGTVFVAILPAGKRNGGHEAVPEMVPCRVSFSFFSVGLGGCGCVATGELLGVPLSAEKTGRFGECGRDRVSDGNVSANPLARMTGVGASRRLVVSRPAAVSSAPRDRVCRSVCVWVHVCLCVCVPS